MRAEALIIKQTIDMTDVLKKYGMTPNRAGFIRCPFHSEKTASMKVYKGDKGFHCFGCGANGDVITFIQMLFNVSFDGAIKIINNDFGLGLFKSNSSYREQMKLQKRVGELRDRKIAEDLERLKKESEYDELMAEYAKCDIIVRELKPKSPDEELSDIYVWAMHRIPYLEYRLDTIDI